ncbi:MAG: KH domain-containing protein [archaeon]|jgi:exosome complex component RRP4
MKEVVVPGQLVSEDRKKIGSNVYIANGRIYSKVLGITDTEGDFANVVPLNGLYMPVQDDVVIGVVSRVVFAGYGIDVNSFGSSFIPKSAMREELRMGDLISAKVSYVNELREAELDFPRKLMGGDVIEVTPVRVPRLIGKNASMLELLKNGTGANIIIGKNGRVWARDGNFELLKELVSFINENSYKSHLTSTVEEILKKKGKKVSGENPQSERN